MQDPQIGRWVQVDPESDKYNNVSPYVYGSDNPGIFKDPNGADIVYFNNEGTEVNRVVSTTQFQTFVGSEGNWQQAPMPKIIKGYELAKYQQNDYTIADQTKIFNNRLSSKTDLPTFDKNHKIGKDLPAQLDPTLVKAITIQESRGGTWEGNTHGLSDIMTVNFPGDWTDAKEQVGVSYGEKMTPSSSVGAGIKWLFLKGEGSNGKGEMNWRSGNGGDWYDAVHGYGPGDKKDPNYTGKIKTMVDNAQTPTPQNYTK